MSPSVASQPTTINTTVRAGNDSQQQAIGIQRTNAWDLRTAEVSTWHQMQKRPSGSIELPQSLQHPGLIADRERTSFPPSTDLRNGSTSSVDNADDRLEPVSRPRQPSIQSEPALMGPRPLDAAGKRYGNSLHRAPQASDQIFATPFNGIKKPYPSSTPSAYRNAHGRDDSINSISRFSFASIAPDVRIPGQEGSTARSNVGKESPLPINFDDFHNNITSTDNALAHSPVPAVVPTSNFPRSNDNSTIPRPVSTSGSVRKASGTGSVVRSGSSKRQQIVVPDTIMRQVSSPENVFASEAGPSLLTRRQILFPPKSLDNSNPTPKTPKKPSRSGAFVTRDSTDKQILRRRPSLGARKSVIEKTPVQSTFRHDSKPVDSGDTVASPATGRRTKAKSLQSLNGKSSYESSTSPQSPDCSTFSLANPCRSPGRALGPTFSPSTLSKRLSAMPHHATGLGARTVSPTDARRLKRLSIMPHAPPLPTLAAPHTPATSHHPDIAPIFPRSAPHSPALNSPKSVTPPSSRATPDPNRKSYSSGHSLSSSTSYNSNKIAAASTSRQPPGSTSSSRWPTSKPRLDTNNASEAEEVPPVPAIPKAYESPLSDIDQPFFSTRSSSLPQAGTPIRGSPTVQSLADAMAALETPKDRGTPSRKSSLIPEGELRSNHVGTKPHPPTRLPPINVLPLSTPTAAKIMSLHNAKSPEDGAWSPPPQDRTTKMPSTPMTASRVDLPSKTHFDSQASPAMKIRSNSSHHSLRADYDSLTASLRVNNSIPFSLSTLDNGPRNISPFISSSLPKSCKDFTNCMQPKYGADSDREGMHTKSSDSTALGSSRVSKVEERPSNDDAESSFSASAIRRKLSLSRRRSSSRTQETTEANVANKYNSMPPPKLPASATWNNLAVTSGSPTQRQSFLNNRRKPSTSSFNKGLVNSGQNAQSDQSLHLGSPPSIDSNSSITLHSRCPPPMISPAPGAQITTSGRHPRPRGIGLDRDDMLAEDEMKKLASKRKDVEAAAKELDALRQRARPREGVFPSQALQAGNLNIFERGEIVDYEHIYFTGRRGARKIGGDVDTASSNFGYDDERGDYNIIHGDHLAFRYEVVDLLGKGSFGQVVRCIDHQTGILVAVKIIRNKKRFHQQALVEVNILQKLREWDPENEHSVVTFDQSFYFRGHLCISTDLLDMNLYEFIKAYNFRGFSLKLIRRFTKQLLRSLVLLNSHKVIHCDLKPENVLLAHPMHSDIKVIDFGSSCFENEKVYTYIQSRFYRSPEVILGMSYGMPIDMWSLGCILAELYTGYPIFPGENEQEQLACIMEIFGPPEKHLIEKSTRKKLFFDSLGKPRLTVSSKGRRRRPSSKELRQVLKCDDEVFLDFVAKCLRWDPARRLTPHQALTHEFVTGAKISSRRANIGSSTNSPVKRGSSISTSATRPLPRLPSTVIKGGAATWQNGATSSTTSKPATKRNSTINGAPPPPYSLKQPTHMNPTTTGPSTRRLTHGPKSVSGRPDLATAAAAAASLRL